MSSFSGNVNTIIILNTVSIQINRYLSIIIFIFGISGNILNIFVFLHRTLRSNPCASLFLASSIANIICILSGLISRMLSGWAADLTSTIGWICKMRAFIVWVTRTFFMWTITLTTIDRWLLSSSNVHYRQMSTLKNARRGMFIILFLSLFININVFYCFESNLIDTPLACYSKTKICRFITDFIFTLIIYTIPLFFIFIFGLLTIRNIHQAQHCRIQPIPVVVIRTSPETAVQFHNFRLLSLKNLDRRLLKIHLIQVIIISILVLPNVIQKVYSTLTLYKYKSSLQITIENFIYNIAILLNFTSCGLPFYIFTLCGGRTFRNAFCDILKKMNYYIGHQNI